MSRSVTVHSMQVRMPRKRKNNPPQVLTSLPVDTSDFMVWLQGALSGVDDSDLIDKKLKKYIRIRQVALVPNRPRVLQVDLEVGRYGQKGRNRNVDDHSETHSHDTNEAPVLDVRAIFLVPPGARMAMVFIEQVHQHAVAEPLLKRLAVAWMDEPWAAKWSLRNERLHQQQAWLQAVDLLRVRAFRYGHKSDFEALGAVGSSIGDLEINLTPSSGKNLKKSLLTELMQASAAKRAKVLGLEGLADELDEVKVQVEGANGQKKEFVIDKAKVPSVRLPLADLEGDTGMPHHLISRVVSEAPDFYAWMGMEWHDV